MHGLAKSVALATENGVTAKAWVLVLPPRRVRTGARLVAEDQKIANAETCKVSVVERKPYNTTLGGLEVECSCSTGCNQNETKQKLSQAHRSRPHHG